jgi:hypothetical protein
MGTCSHDGQARPGRPPGGGAVSWLGEWVEGRGVFLTHSPCQLGSSAGRRVDRHLQVGAGRVADIEGLDLLLDDVRPGRAVVAGHQHHRGSGRIHSTDGAAASGLTTIHQTVTACPAGSPLVWSEKEMPLSVRTSVEVPTAPVELVTGLVPTGLVVGAAPARLMRTTENSPTRARATSIRCFTTLFPPVGLGTGHKGWSLVQSVAPCKLG